MTGSDRLAILHIMEARVYRKTFLEPEEGASGSPPIVHPPREPVEGNP